jgi:RND family efflux transporter MFP subunit
MMAFAAGTFLGCGGGQEEAKKPGGMGTLITTAREQSREVQVVEESVGWIESSTAPLVAAETAARVVSISADMGDSVEAGKILAVLDDQDLQVARDAARAEVNRLQALAEHQERQVARFRQLYQEELVSQSQIEDAEAQATALSQQLSGARAQLVRIELDLGKTKVRSPVKGRVETRQVSVGDFVKIGDPMFQLTTLGRLRVHLPFPEEAATRLKPGLHVELSSPTAPGQVVQGRITEIRPAIGSNTRSVEVIAAISNPGGWKPGGTVDGKVILEERTSMTVPEQSVVRRPAGDVVYAIEDNKAVQRVVKTGIRQAGYVEILSGIAPGETVALDGAGFLTDGAPVRIKTQES